MFLFFGIIKVPRSNTSGCDEDTDVCDEVTNGLDEFANGFDELEGISRGRKCLGPEVLFW